MLIATMKPKTVLSLFLLSSALGCAADRSLDLTYRDFGVSVGNSRVTHGLRFNAIDRDVEVVDGLNLTIWYPGRNDAFQMRGLAFGLIRTYANDMVGVSAAPVVGGQDVSGLQLGLLTTTVDGTANGINLGLIRAYAGRRLLGLNAGFMIAGGGDVDGVTASLLYLSPQPLSDLEGPPAGSIHGIALSGLVLDYPEAVGLIGSGFNWTRRTTGVALGYVMNEARESMTGLAIAPFNTAKDLRGVQIGLLNHAGSNPPYLRWLPLMNVGFGSTRTDP